VNDILIARLKQEIAKQGFNYKSLSLAAGLGETTVRDIITGRARNSRRDTLQKIAQVLGRPLSYFFAEDMAATVPLMHMTSQRRGAGAHGVAEHCSPSSNCDAVEAPPELGYRDMMALQARGDSMLPFIPDGTVVYYSRNPRDEYDHFVNKLCVAQVKDGAILLRILKRGSFYGRYTLAAYDGTEMQNAELEWCARVLFIKPV
jgi:transcriptional regulator with XRE-family HTH domain